MQEEANEVFVSAASAWEIATKVQLGKLPEGDPFDRMIAAQAVADDLLVLSIDTKLD